jgi:hypothetical protein
MNRTEPTFRRELMITGWSKTRSLHLLQLLQPGGSPAYCLWANEGKLILSTPKEAMLILFRSGKSSISSVVFHKMPPNETLFLESTARIQKDSMQYVLSLPSAIHAY